MSRLILFPGLGADHRMFSRLKEVGVEFITFPLPEPVAGEGLSEYALRATGTLKLSADDFIGGCSFGSVVATAVSRQVPSRGLILIGGALNGMTLRGFKWLPRIFRPYFPLSLFKPFLRTDQAMHYLFGSDNQAMNDLASAMLADTSDTMLVRGGRMLAVYGEQLKPLCPVFAIHGSMDRVMDPPPVEKCLIVPDAGHGIAYTHADEVATFLKEIQAVPDQGAEF
ncbi:alpha/beta hydrolase [Geoalkalibacter halelectricus]|uniref:Alpha/beta hydrolase n=1 Tax=Geoalkalibacter halelectricus TaxID=2847045 RepID=A0ABY5ZPU1_9BACT|nr:alpha/beta hydrolase [Geoalkalibacter halelectricus]MDO3379802.1 alpha/beta hydrolase [Geoalkalibacter halelectricus]UWZ79236.1 alpha/beta hydrolase [Geoalkalibacter halelectricus]